jgi:hypothetical protein
MWEFRESETKRFKLMPAKSIDAIESSYQSTLIKRKFGQDITIVDNDQFKLDFTDNSCPKLVEPKSGQLRYGIDSNHKISINIFLI